MCLKEKDLYEPARKALLQKFSEKGECHLEVTATAIGEQLKLVLDDQAVYILETEKKKPDLLGFLKVKSELGYESKKLIVAEVKSKSLTLEDIYQLKMYSEMLGSHFAYLISPKGFSEARRRFLIYRHSVLQISTGVRQISVLQLTEEDTLVTDEKLCSYRPFDP